jgi:hypothetical protein
MVIKHLVPDLRFKVELEAILPLPESPTYIKLSGKEWAKTVAPLRRALQSAGISDCTVKKENMERNLENWCIMRDITDIADTAGMNQTGMAKECKYIAHHCHPPYPPTVGTLVIGCIAPTLTLGQP